MSRVIVADTQALFRAGIVRVLSGEEEFRIVAQCGDWKMLFHAVSTHPESIVIASSAIVAELAQLVGKARQLQSRVLLIAEETEPLIKYRASGVSGLLRRNTTGKAFLETVHKVADGVEFFLPADPTLSFDVAGSRVANSLTKSEMRIVALLMEGMKNKDIADRLHTTEQVVKNRLRSIYDKTGVSDRLELALFTMHHRALSVAAAETFAQLPEPEI